MRTSIHTTTVVCKLEGNLTSANVEVLDIWRRDEYVCSKTSLDVAIIHRSKFPNLTYWRDRICKKKSRWTGRVGGVYSPCTLFFSIDCLSALSSWWKALGGFPKVSPSSCWMICCSSPRLAGAAIQRESFYGGQRNKVMNHLLSSPLHSQFMIRLHFASGRLYVQAMQISSFTIAHGWKHFILHNMSLKQLHEENKPVGGWWELY